MKTKLLLTFCFLVISCISFAGKFVLVPVNETSHLESLFDNKDLKIHYYSNEYILATTDNLNFEGLVVLDDYAFVDVNSYAIVYCYEDKKEEYLTKISTRAKTLFAGKNFFIMKILQDGFIPAKNDGMVVIMNKEARLPKSVFDFPKVTEVDSNIQFFIDEINTDTLMAYVQHLQNYGTRVYNKPQAIEAQDWIKDKFEAMGLEVELQAISVADFSKNVIAVQTGSVYPDKFIVCGAHYDSYVHNIWWLPPPVPNPPALDLNNSPGADDNATGTAGILETARILSQYEFEYSIIYCSFSAEEIGLWGSEEYASRCAMQGMDILGYFNIDMSGYLAPGETQITISLIRKPSSNPLAAYYTDIVNVYFPEVSLTHHEGLNGGDSDHTSFDNNGYQGIYPFENMDNYSPYIHWTGLDTIGLSVNNPNQVRIFTQANIAGIATLAKMILPLPFAPPTNCVATWVEELGYDENNVSITWDPPTENTPDEYFVFRDDEKIAQTTDTHFMDTRDTNGIFCYKIAAVYEDVVSEFSNESCVTIPTIGVTEYSSNFKVYPNPATDEITIQCEKLQANYKLQADIFDINGKKTSSHPLISSSSHQTFNISHLSSGIYFIKISNELIGKFIKE